MTKNRITVKGLKGLELAVARICNGYADGYEDGTRGYLRDLFYGGCVSGVVGELIYYRDTTRFYRKHQAAIRALVVDALTDYGCASVGDLFPGRAAWDGSDPFADDEGNQQLLAWFGFEETARWLAYRMGWDC